MLKVPFPALFIHHITLHGTRRKYGDSIIWDDKYDATEDVPPAEATWGTGAGTWVRIAGRRRGCYDEARWIESLSEAAVS